jgi:hypothetical protein
VNTNTMMKARITHLALFAALAASFLGKCGWLGYADGAW